MHGRLRRLLMSAGCAETSPAPAWPPSSFAACRPEPAPLHGDRATGPATRPNASATKLTSCGLCESAIAHPSAPASRLPVAAIAGRRPMERTGWLTMRCTRRTSSGRRSQSPSTSEKPLAKQGKLRQPREAKRVGLAAGAGLHHAIVAGQFALGAQPPLHPQQHRVQGEKHQADLLQEVGPVVAAAQVLHLVQDHLLQFLRASGARRRAGGTRTRGRRKPSTLGRTTSSEMHNSAVRPPGASASSACNSASTSTGTARRASRRRCAMPRINCTALHEESAHPQCDDSEAPARIEMQRMARWPPVRSGARPAQRPERNAEGPAE